MEIVDDKKYILVTLEYDEDEDGKYEEMSGRKLRGYFHDLAEQRFWDGEENAKFTHDDDEYVLPLLHVIKGESAAVLRMLKDWSYALIEKDPDVEGVADYQHNRIQLINQHGYDADVVNEISEKEVRLRVWLYEAAPSYANMTQENQELATCLGGTDDTVAYLLAHPHAMKDTYYDDVVGTGLYYLDLKLNREGKLMQIENNKSYILVDLEKQEQPEKGFQIMSGSDIIAFFKGLADKRLEQSFKSDFPDSDEVLLWLVHASRGEEAAIRALLDVNEWLYAVVEKDPSRPGIEDYLAERKALLADQGYEESYVNTMDEKGVAIRFVLGEATAVEMADHFNEKESTLMGGIEASIAYLRAHPIQPEELVIWDVSPSGGSIYWLWKPVRDEWDRIVSEKEIKSPDPDAQSYITYSIRELEEILQLQGINLAHFAALAGKHGWNDADYCDFVRALYKSDTFNEAWEKDAIADPSKFVVKSDMYRNTELILKAVREVLDKGI